MSKYSLFFIVILTFILSACTEKEHQVHWDRDMCERCKMVVSDRKNTVRMQDLSSKKYFVYDDIGCYVWWLEKNPKADKNAKTLINDSQTGEWIDIKTALYTSGNISPMGYGFWAYKKGTEPKDKEILSYEAVKKQIIARGR